MKFVKGLALLIAAIFVTKVLITAVGLLLSIVPMIFELSVNEASLRVTYVILTAYFLTVVILLAITGVSLYSQATKKNFFKLNIVLCAISLFIYGAHLVLAMVGDSNAHLLVQFANSFIWVPMLGGFAVIISFLTSKSQG